ncbi:acyl-CoA dehydrogenase [Amycolatopsis ultiminotia]|uniref:Acyl-CoA dehydrogenase n=1 Tax=Amycolatopsis ultiminotia TaxID=543629 RepID=A0ABP6XX18_9PSEU
MRFSDTVEEQRFRAELRAWLADAVRRHWGDDPITEARQDVQRLRDWSRLLHQAGWIGITWPHEYGGRGLPQSCQNIFYEELGRAGAPNHINTIGLNFVAPTIIEWGDQDQARRFLPPLLSGDEIWCQGFSEPGAGSDLANVRTRAVLDGEEWVVNGQKIWSSFAHLADMCILVVRTEEDVPSHRALTFLLLDMRTPGVTVRPLTQLTGAAEFNEVFLDDVRIPVSRGLGERGEGWRVIMTTLEHERGTLAMELAADFSRQLDRAVTHLRDNATAVPDHHVRRGVADAWVLVQELRYTNYRFRTEAGETGSPGPKGSVAKIAWSEGHQRLTALALESQGLASVLNGASAAESGYWQLERLRSRGNSIEGGTTEIQKNIIAERVLGLPRGR